MFHVEHFLLLSLRDWLLCRCSGFSRVLFRCRLFLRDCKNRSPVICFRQIERKLPCQLCSQEGSCFLSGRHFIGYFITFIGNKSSSHLYKGKTVFIERTQVGNSPRHRIVILFPVFFVFSKLLCSCMNAADILQFTLFNGILQKINSLIQGIHQCHLYFRKAMAIGIPGNPAPVPTSIIFTPEASDNVSRGTLVRNE